MSYAQAGWYFEGTANRFFHAIDIINNFIYVAYTYDSSAGGGGTYTAILKIDATTLAVVAARKLVPPSGNCSIQGLRVDSTGTYLYAIGFGGSTSNVNVHKLNCSDLSVVDDKYIANTYSSQDLCLGTDYSGNNCIFGAGFPNTATDLHLFKLYTDLTGDTNEQMYTQTDLGLPRKIIKDVSSNHLWVCGAAQSSGAVYWGSYIYRVNQASGGLLSGGSSLLVYTVSGTIPSVGTLSCMLFDVKNDGDYLWATGWLPTATTSLGADTLLIRAKKENVGDSNRLQLSNAWRVAHSTEYAMRGMGLYVDSSDVYISTGLFPHSGLGDTDYEKDCGCSVMRLDKTTLLGATPGSSQIWSRGLVRYDHPTNTTFYSNDNHDQNAIFDMTCDGTHLYCAGWTEVEVVRKISRQSALRTESVTSDTNKVPMLWKIPMGNGGLPEKYDNDRGKHYIYNNASEITITNIASETYLVNLVADMALTVTSYNFADVSFTNTSTFPLTTPTLQMPLTFQDPTHHTYVEITGEGTYDNPNQMLGTDNVDMWKNLDDPIGSPNGATDEVRHTSSGTSWSVMTAAHSFTKTQGEALGTLREIRVYTRGYTTNAGNGYYAGTMYVPSKYAANYGTAVFYNTTYSAGDVDGKLALAMNDFTNVVSGGWSWQDVDDCEFGVGVVRNASSVIGYATQVFMELNYSPPTPTHTRWYCKRW